MYYVSQRVLKVIINGVERKNLNANLLSSCCNASTQHVIMLQFAQSFFQLMKYVQSIARFYRNVLADIRNSKNVLFYLWSCCSVDSTLLKYID